MISLDIPNSKLVYHKCTYKYLHTDGAEGLSWKLQVKMLVGSFKQIVFFTYNIKEEKNLLG
jgi:hypothetical protein